MLVLRTEQVEMIQKPKVDQLLRWIERHLIQYFPERARAMGPEKLRAFVEDSYECCNDLGITTSACICKFTDMRFALGEEFYLTPNFPWAARILNDPSIPDVNERVEQMAHIAARL